MDRSEAIELGEVISSGEALTEERQAFMCKKLARRYALQAVKRVWNDGGSAALRQLFDGRCPRTGRPLNWGAELPDAGDADRDDPEDDDPAEEADADFIDDADAGFISDEEEEEAEDSDEEAEASGETGGAAQTPQAPATYRKSQSARAVFCNAPASAAARDALNARRDALHEAWEMAQAHADGLKKKLSAVERQMERQRKCAAADARAAAQAARAASRAAASPPPPLHAASGEGLGDFDELPPVPAGVLKAAAAAAPRGRRARSSTPVPGLSDSESEDSWDPSQRRAVKRKIAFSEDDEA
jgi:hypothetical protein